MTDSAVDSGTVIFDAATHTLSIEGPGGLSRTFNTWGRYIDESSGSLIRLRIMLDYADDQAGNVIFNYDPSSDRFGETPWATVEFKLIKTFSNLHPWIHSWWEISYFTIY